MRQACPSPPRRGAGPALQARSLRPRVGSPRSAPGDSFAAAGRGGARPSGAGRRSRGAGPGRPPAERLHPAGRGRGLPPPPRAARGGLRRPGPGSSAAVGMPKNATWRLRLAGSSESRSCAVLRSCVTSEPASTSASAAAAAATANAVRAARRSLCRRRIAARRSGCPTRRRNESTAQPLPERQPRSRNHRGFFAERKIRADPQRPAHALPGGSAESGTITRGPERALFGSRPQPSRGGIRLSSAGSKSRLF